MLKRIVLFFSILCAGLILNSCSESLDRTSSVSFKLSDSFFREALNSGSVSSDSSSTAKEYVVKVSVSWDNQNIPDEKKVTFDDEGKIVCPEFTFEDLPAGKTVKIDVSISCGGTVIYRSKTVEQKLKAGLNKCPVTLEKQVADVAISIENKDSLNLESSYKLLVEITDSSNKTEKDYPIDETNIYTIAQNKTIGETLKIEVSVYNNSLCLYKTLEPVSATVAKENNIKVTLSNAVSTAAVWQNRMSSGNNAVFYQNKNFNAMQESDCFNGAVPGIYAFDNSGNLWIHSFSAFDDANKPTVTFTIYPLDSNELIYKAENTNSFVITLQSEATTKDIYFDSGFLYVLTEKKSSESGGCNYYVTKYNTETKEYNEKLVIFDSGSASLSMLAVHNDMVVVSSGTGIFYIENLLISTTFKEFPVDFANLLTGMNIELTQKVSITDLQFGDGLGNDTDKLYALVRNCSSSISNTDSDSTYYSSGALVEIDVEKLESNYKLYGNAAENNTVQITAAGTDKDVVFVSPVDDSNFFGPYKFVALAPRKLVILDDGVSVDTDNKKLTNNDALFEFDIAEKTINKGESVSASVPYVSGFATDW